MGKIKKAASILAVIGISVLTGIGGGSKHLKEAFKHGNLIILGIFKSSQYHKLDCIN